MSVWFICAGNTWGNFPLNREREKKTAKHFWNIKIVDLPVNRREWGKKWPKICQSVNAYYEFVIEHDLHKTRRTYSCVHVTRFTRERGWDIELVLNEPLIFCVFFFIQNASFYLARSPNIHWLVCVWVIVWRKLPFNSFVCHSCALHNHYTMELSQMAIWCRLLWDIYVGFFSVDVVAVCCTV